LFSGSVYAIKALRMEFVLWHNVNLPMA
jgi:hypothetical protein